MPQNNDIAARCDRITVALACVITDLDGMRKPSEDTELLDWFSAPHGCEPMEVVRYDGKREWRYMGIGYDNLRAAIRAAMAREKGAK